jgi:DNA-binding NtrC family response regulator
MSSPQGRILIVDDEAGIRELLSRLVQQEGYESQEAADGEEALAVIRRASPDVMLLDIRLPGLDGMEVLQQARKLDPDLPVVMITSQGTVKDAVVALRAGAHDYLVKPFEHADVIRSMRNAMTNRGLRRAIQMLSDRTPEAAHLRDMMGSSEVVSRICGDVARVAWSDFTVLIIGETGTGKELVARAIHQASGRAAAPFIPVDCGAIPETLFESELFGHEKGAFTGADRSKPGKFEMAAGGTVFLDEILNMPVASQVKLLRALQERTIYHVGGTKPIAVDCRVLVAANEDIEAAVAKDRFRKDLFFRLDEFTIRVPPLRERRQDIAFLAKRFLDLTNQELGKEVSGLTQRATELLLAFHWPGNVRQLRSTIRRAVLLADTVIDEEHLGLPRQSCPSIAESESLLAPAKGLPLKQLVRRATVTVERAALLHTLAKTGWNKAKAAPFLQIDYKTMHSKLKEHGLKAPGGREHDDEEDEGHGSGG